jgi:hypothetical protein
LIKCIMLLVTVVLVMAAMVVTSALPALAQETSCEELAAELEDALYYVDPDEVLSLIVENPQCFPADNLFAIAHDLLELGVPIEDIDAGIQTLEDEGLISPTLAEELRHILVDEEAGEGTERGAEGVGLEFGAQKLESGDL